MKVNDDNFAAFIVTHKRADKVYTYNLLKKSHYTGKIYLIVDDEDEQLPEYKKRYGDIVLTFSKQQMLDNREFDLCDNLKSKKTVTYVRNAVFKIAKQLKLDYFLLLDDDYKSFRHRFDADKNFISKKVVNLDNVFNAFLEFHIASGSYATCLSQEGDFIGGDNSAVAKKHMKNDFSRKAMNVYFISVNKPFKFLGTLNEDVNTYCSLGNRGHLFITVPRVSVGQIETQQNPGGLTDIYLKMGTYKKSFYSVMICPSFVKISTMGVTDQRIHHKIKWDNAIPKIVNEKYHGNREAKENL